MKRKYKLNKMKYVVVISIDDKTRWSQWHSGSTATVYRSDGFDTRKEAKIWLDNQMKTINNYIKESNQLGADYIVKTLIGKFENKDIIANKDNIFPKIDYMFTNVLRHVKEIKL